MQPSTTTDQLAVLAMDSTTPPTATDTPAQQPPSPAEKVFGTVELEQRIFSFLSVFDMARSESVSSAWCHDLRKPGLTVLDNAQFKRPQPRSQLPKLAPRLLACDNATESTHRHALRHLGAHTRLHPLLGNYSCTCPAHRHHGRMVRHARPNWSRLRTLRPGSWRQEYISQPPVRAVTLWNHPNWHRFRVVRKGADGLRLGELVDEEHRVHKLLVQQYNFLQHAHAPLSLVFETEAESDPNNFRVLRSGRAYKYWPGM